MGLQPSKIREDHWSFDQDLEGARSLGAALDDGSSVSLGQHMVEPWVFIGSRGARESASHNVDFDLEGYAPP